MQFPKNEIDFLDRKKKHTDIEQKMRKYRGGGKTFCLPEGFLF